MLENQFQEKNFSIEIRYKRLSLVSILYTDEISYSVISRPIIIAWYGEIFYNYKDFKGKRKKKFASFSALTWKAFQDMRIMRILLQS